MQGKPPSGGLAIVLDQAPVDQDCLHIAPDGVAGRVGTQVLVGAVGAQPTNVTVHARETSADWARWQSRPAISATAGR